MMRRGSTLEPVRDGKSNSEEVNFRVSSRLDTLPLTDEAHIAALWLAVTRDYTKAAEKAGVTREQVLEWTESDNFVAAVGLNLIGLADNHD